MNFITNIEKLKTTFLVVLFSITILLLYFLWGDNFLEKKFVSKQNAVIPDTNQEMQIKKFFKPFRARINFGGSNYTVLYAGIENVWIEFIDSFYPLNQTGDIFIDTIEEVQWNKILDSKSVQFDFGYDVPFDAMKEALGLGDIPGDTNIETISKAAYSVAIKNSHFIYDGQNNQYYRIRSDNEHIEILDEISKIEKRNYDNYTPIGKYFDLDNNSLMPFRLKNNMENVSCEQEIQFYENSLAEKFFGESFDFVRKIVETNGTIIYMYGYGEKMLTVSNNGYLEYKEELDIENHANADYVDALSIATTYVTNHGNWQTLKGTEIYPYLKTTEEVTDPKQTGYKFKFGYRINGYPVCYEKEEAIEVEVIGKQVVYYKRFILNQKDTIQYLDDENDEEPNQNIISTADILTNNYEIIKAIYAENGYDFTEKSYEEILAIMVKDINRVDVSYYLKDNGIGGADEIILIPSWVFMTDKFKMHFNIQTGNHLGWSSLE